MSKKIQLKIAEPCHENWDNMNPFEKGKFCGSCQKQVIDFSNMSDHQVAQFFKKPILSLSKGGSVCGRFMTDQLNRNIEIPKKRIPWVKYFFNLLLPVFFLSKASAQQVKIGKIAAVNNDTIRTPMLNEPRMLGMVIKNNIEPFEMDTIKVETPITDSKSIRGKILNENGDPIAFASIQIGKTLNVFVADENGGFEINKKLIGVNKSLLISSVGFGSKEVLIDDLTKNLNITLTTIMMGDVVVSSSQCFIKREMIAGAVSVIKGEVDNSMSLDNIIERDIPIPAESNKFFVYPNPVLSGGNIALGFRMMEEGYYLMQFINQSGQLIHQKEIWIDVETRVLNLEVPKVAAGSYFMVLSNKKTGKKMTEKIIIQ